MKTYTLAVLLAIAFCLTPARAQTTRPADKPAKRPVPAIEHVVIVSIDGGRPDILLLADTPNVHALIKNGAYTMWAKTTAVALTLPSHVSMLTGVIPVRH